MARETNFILYYFNGTKRIIRGANIHAACKANNIVYADVDFHSDLSCEDYCWVKGEWVHKPDPEFRAKNVVLAKERTAIEEPATTTED